MSKTVCVICGTEYDDSNSKTCPVCGWSQEGASAENIALDDLNFEDVTRKNREVFDYDAVNNPPLDEEDPDEMSAYADDDYEEEAPRSNTGLVVILTVLIVLLLVASGFLLVKYLLPNMGGKKPAETPPTEAITQETLESETTQPTIPCTGLAITSGKVELTREGQWFLIHTVVTPSDTTDALSFTSQDETVATVDGEGKITAVGEGETNILVQCGEQSYLYPVLVLYVDEVTETTEAETEAPNDAQTEDTQPENGKTEETQETTGAAQEPTETTQASLKDVTLKLKRTDITIGRRGVYVTLELDCDLSPEEVTWSSDNTGICTVDNVGNVTAVGTGTTKVRAAYGDQTVEVWVRCKF